MSTVAALPRHFREAIQRELPGERIVWSGRPSPKRTFFATVPVWLFAIPWTAFSLFWEIMALQGWFSGKPPPSATSAMFGVVFPLFGLPFVAIGLAMMASPVLAWWRAHHTVHVATEDRLVTLVLGGRLKVVSFALGAILRTERVDHGEGLGTLKVVTGRHVDSDGDLVEASETFYAVADAVKLERLVAGRMTEKVA